MGYSPWNHKGWDTTERLDFHFQKGMATSIGQYAPVFLPVNPFSDREAWPATVYWVAKSQTLPKQPCTRRCKTFLPVAALPQSRVEYVGGAAAWLAGTLPEPSVQGHGLPLLQELRFYQSLFSSLS